MTTTGTPSANKPGRSCAGLGCLLLVSAIGVLMLLITVASLHFNETHLIQATRPLGFARENVINVPSDRVDPANEGKLVHITGPLEAPEPLRDPDFGIEVPAIALSREMEVMQWVERGPAGNTRHEKRWEDKYIDSSKFRQPTGHENPADLPFPPEDQIGNPNLAYGASIGAFQPQVDRLGLSESSLAPNVAVGSGDPKPPEPVFRGLGGRYMEPGWLYFGQDPANPEVGDVRAKFTYFKPQIVSLIGRQHGNGIEPQPIENGETLYLFEPGEKSAEAMINEDSLASHALAWFSRLFGGLCLLVFMAMSYRALRKAFSIIPVLGTIFRAGGVAVTILGTIALYFTIIAIPWLTVRPLLAVALLALASVLLSTLHTMGQRRRRVTEESYLRDLGRADPGEGSP